jgi:GST-like protein
MIDLYTFGTPNGKKASVMLEEVGLPYETHVVDIRKGDQQAPAFLAVNPNGKIPAIVDRGAAGEPVTVFESGAILIYLAEKTGQLLAPAGKARYEALEWLMFQMGGIGPMFGQYNHFANAAPEKIPYAIERYQKESLRLLGVLDGHLAGREYLAGAYSIADVCNYTWVSAVGSRLPGGADFKHVNAWVERVGARPAVQKGMAVPA